MKKYIIGLVCILLSAASMNGQSKKELEAQVVKLQTELDSTKTNYNSLSADHDSTTAILETYIGMHKTIQEKVLHFDFAPEDMGTIIDSLQTTRDSSLNSIMAGSESLRDTITFMSTAMDSLNTVVETQQAEIAELKGQVEKFKDPSGFTDDQVAALEKLKKLLDAGILDKEEFEAKKDMILGIEEPAADPDKK